MPFCHEDMQSNQTSTKEPGPSSSTGGAVQSPRAGTSANRAYRALTIATEHCKDPFYELEAFYPRKRMIQATVPDQRPEETAAKSAGVLVSSVLFLKVCTVFQTQ
jgi:hypothetical protein